jgi:hypothetical protein
MKKLAILLALPLALTLASCGSTSTTSFALTSGSFNPSGGTATAAFPADNCNVVAFFGLGADPFPVVVATDGKSATFNFSSTNDAAHQETVSIDGNGLVGTVSASYQTVFTSTCVTNYTVKVVSGELTAKDAMHLVLQYDIANASGSLCVPTDVDTKTLPCTSQVDLIAGKGT